MEPIDYTKYSLSQLEDVCRHINREKYPERYEAVLAELDKRRQAESPKRELTKSERVVGKFFLAKSGTIVLMTYALISRYVGSIWALTFLLLAGISLYIFMRSVDKRDKQWRHLTGR